MARIAPNVLEVQTNLSGAVTDIDDDPDSPDGNWLTANAQNTQSVCRVEFPTPSGNLTTGAGLQEFRVQVRLSATNNGNNNGVVNVYLYENNSQVGTVLATNSAIGGTATVISATWNAADLATSDGSLVECHVIGDPETGGAAGTRGSIEIGAIEWNSAENIEYVYTISNTPITFSGDATTLFEQAISIDLESLTLTSNTVNLLEIIPTDLSTLTLAQQDSTIIDTISIDTSTLSLSALSSLEFNEYPYTITNTPITFSGAANSEFAGGAGITYYHGLKGRIIFSGTSPEVREQIYAPSGGFLMKGGAPRQLRIVREP